MTTKITVDNLAPTLVATIEAGGGPKISNVKIANVSYTLIDDTAVSLGGGYIIVNGTGFESNVNLLIDGTAATSVTRISATEIRAQIPALTAGSKVVYLTNTDTGATAIRVNGVTYSGTPTWVTGSTLTNGLIDEAISIQLSANSDSNVSYQLQSGSTLPTGLTLAANGLLTGTVTGITQETLYNFTVEAIDAENQESPRSFSITITVGDEYFNYTTLLLTGDGANAAQNNTFLDSSTNNFTITRNGNPTQGSFSPFSQTGWSNYFDGNGDYLSLPSSSNLALGSGNYTIELFVYISAFTEYGTFVTTYNNSAQAGAWFLRINASTQNWQFQNGANGSAPNFQAITSSSTLTLGTWTHLAVVKNSGTITLYQNGVSVGSAADAETLIAPNFTIGQAVNGYPLNGYISNLRLVKGSAVYTAAFTPPTAPLTAVANTQLLTCQSNRFRDASSNNFAITVNGNTSVQAFSPFAPTAAYSAATVGGSGYFDGSGDYLSVPSNAAFGYGTGDFTIECWVYPLASTAQRLVFGGGDLNNLDIGFNPVNTFQYYDGTVRDTGISAASRQWFHFAVSRISGTTSVYINGTRTNNFSDTSNSSARQVFVAGSNTGTNPFNGYINDVRIIKGQGIYSGTTITIPNAPLTTTGYGSTSQNITGTVGLLLNFTNGGIIDNTAKNVVETVGYAQISTSVKKFGTGSILLTPGGGSHYTRVPLTENLRFGTGDFTIECWIYLITNTAGIRAVWSNYSGFSAGSLSLFAGHASASTNNFYIAHNGGFPALASTTTVNSRLGLWTHLAVVRNSGQIKLYVNGVSEGTPFASTVALDGVGSYFWVGTTGDSPASNPNCYIDDFRITKGVARYTANFTPPTSAHKIK